MTGGLTGSPGSDTFVTVTVIVWYVCSSHVPPCRWSHCTLTTYLLSSFASCGSSWSGTMLNLSSPVDET